MSKADGIVIMVTVILSAATVCAFIHDEIKALRQEMRRLMRAAPERSEAT